MPFEAQLPGEYEGSHIGGGKGYSVLWKLLYTMGVTVDLCICKEDSGRRTDCDEYI